jgi:hypothetical protein
MATGKRILTTFSSDGWEDTRSRFIREATKMNVFTHIVAAQREDVEREGWPCAHRKKQERGFGYWTWKPIACLRAIREAGADVSDDTSDILVYADVGCTLSNSQSAMRRLSHYFDLVLSHKTGWLSFQNSFTESSWTKGDIFTHLNAWQHANKKQIIATVFILRTTPRNVRILEEWRELCELPHLIDDSPSSTKNARGFVQNRHDQSLLSIVLRKRGSLVLNDETGLLRMYMPMPLPPITATRIRAKNRIIPNVPLSLDAGVQRARDVVFTICSIALLVLVLQRFLFFSKAAVKTKA